MSLFWKPSIKSIHRSQHLNKKTGASMSSSHPKLWSSLDQRKLGLMRGSFREMLQYKGRLAHNWGFYQIQCATLREFSPPLFLFQYILRSTVGKLCGEDPSSKWVFGRDNFEDSFWLQDCRNLKLSIHLGQWARMLVMEIDQQGNDNTSSPQA